MLSQKPWSKWLLLWQHSSYEGDSQRDIYFIALIRASVLSDVEAHVRSPSSWEVDTGGLV